MRVIAGSLGGRQFDAPKGHRTQPMSEKMRGALFSALGDIEGLTVLDAFGGSGAMSFEAISRGAKSSQIVEIDNSAYKTIKNNIKTLGLGRFIKPTGANVSSWSNNNPEESFDMVICNPPFDNLKVELVQKLTTHVKAGGLLVLSWPGRQPAPKLDDMSLAAEKEKDYGDAKLIFYRRVET